MELSEVGCLVWVGISFSPVLDNVVVEGLEPPTFCVSSRYSSQLSYTTITCGASYGQRF